jgi:glycosyltransferase involved in cell wall biosynthesis
VERTLTPQHFERYVRASRGELGVAKQAYVRSRTGAFNDRSLSYLASGRPVVCSDTGLGDWLPVGSGLLTFSDVEGAAAAVAEVEADPAAHGAAARDLAAQHFSADRVLADLLAAVDVPLP